MLTLTYGYLKPQTGDKGSDWFPALETDIQQLNDHTHNGTNSSLIPATSVTALTQNIPAAGWSATSGGMYRQLVTVTGGNLFDSFATPVFKDQTTKVQYFLGVERVSTTTYYIYTNDNTIAVTAYYLT